MNDPIQVSQSGFATIATALVACAKALANDSTDRDKENALDKLTNIDGPNGIYDRRASLNQIDIDLLARGVPVDAARQASKRRVDTGAADLREQMPFATVVVDGEQILVQWDSLGGKPLSMKIG